MVEMQVEIVRMTMRKDWVTMFYFMSWCLQLRRIDAGKRQAIMV